MMSPPDDLKSSNVSTNTAVNTALYPYGLSPLNNVVPATALCVVSIISSLVAVTANGLVLWAIKKTPSLHTPSSALIFVLATSDFAVGAFVQPLVVIKLIALLTNNFPVFFISGTMFYPLAVAFSFVSFVTITAISVFSTRFTSEVCRNCYNQSCYHVYRASLRSSVDTDDSQLLALDEKVVRNHYYRNLFILRCRVHFCNSFFLLQDLCNITTAQKTDP